MNKSEDRIIGSLSHRVIQRAFFNDPMTRWFNDSILRLGLGIIEVLISLSIVAILLVAASAAFTASASIIEHNDEFFRATQASRVSLNQLMTDIRRAESILNVTSGAIELIRYDGDRVTYSYSSTDRKLRLITNDIGTDPDYTLASNVDLASFSADTAVPEGGGTPYIVRVSATIEVKVGDNRVRLTGSSAPRRMQTYN